MKLFFKKLSFFILLGMIMFFGSNKWISQYRTESSELKYRELFEPKERSNVIIIGSSHAEAAINPKYLEDADHRVYNFSFSGGNPILYSKWYTGLFKDFYPKPDVIIFAVDWFMFDDKWLWRRFEHDSEYFPWGTFLKCFFDPDVSKETLLKNRFPLTRDQVNVANILLSKQSVVGYYKGYYPYNTPAILESLDRPNSPKQLKAFLDLLDMFQKDGIWVVFVQTPEYLPGRVANRNNLELLDSIAKKNGIPILNYNTDKVSEINQDKDLFIDWGHLNEEGSRRYTIRLKEDLQVLLDNHEKRLTSNHRL